MSSKIINRIKIELNPSQIKMIKSGWGNGAFENSEVEKIIYMSDGLKVKGYLAYPKETAGKIPCIIWNRGGMKEDGAIDAFTARGIFGQMAGWGYAVFASQYRGNAGGEGEEEFGGSDVNDVLNLMPLAEEIPRADPECWGIEGWSRGGMMTYLAVLKNGNFRCAVLAGAISSLKMSAEDNPAAVENYKKIINIKNLEEELRNRSALNYTDRLPDIPYLIMHGGADETVSPLQSIEMAKCLHSRKIKYRLAIFEGGDHYLRTHRKEVEQLKKQWYDKFLRSAD